MDNLNSILRDHKSKRRISDLNKGTDEEHIERPTTSDIPDLFFDYILKDFKLSRIEIMVLMFLYRQVWCRPNLYKIYGISQLMSHTEMSKKLGLDLEEIYQGLRRLEEYGFITTVRSGQYFVRRYYTKELDYQFGQNYDNFEV